MTTKTFLIVQSAGGKNRATEQVSYAKGGDVYLVNQAMYRSAMQAAQEVLERRPATQEIRHFAKGR